MTDELLIRFLLNETNEEEGVAVQQWLAADRGNRKQFEQFEQIWKASKDLAVSSSRDEDRAWAKFQKNAAASAMANASTEAALTISDDKAGTAKTEPLQEAVIRPLKPGFGWMKIAAMLLLIGGVWAGYTLFGPERYKDLTAYNKVLIAQLPDGSELTLNKTAEISYLRNFKRHRSVKLHKGEVFFSVATQKPRLFFIQIANVSDTLVGTS
jgi:transmembrane sensor